MPEEYEQREENETGPLEENNEAVTPARRRRYFTRRNALFTSGLLAILAVLIAVLAVLFYRNGVVDNYVKTQFVAKMADIGIVFEADVFRLTINPLELELKNATFHDRVTGEKLFSVRDAHLGLTVDNLYAWQLSRDISVNTTDVNGAEIWVRFDENGNSNFSNLKLVEDQNGQRVNFKYDSMRFAVKDSVIHFGDVSRNISADANNVQLFLEPESYDVPDEQKRYKIDFTSTDSTFVYDEHALEDVDVRARGIADRTGAEITDLKIDTPIGVSTMSGTLADWADPKYSLDIESTVDLTQTSNTFPLGANLRGVGNFKGKVTGEGEKYRIEGTADSQALTAEGIYLKAVNVAATVEGTNSNYEANGKAVAELLTFEDFRIDFLRMAGNVRGSGTDFRWVGELQAAAAKTKSLTLGGLFLSDAVAEYKDKQLTATAGNARAQRFSVAEAEFETLYANDLRIAHSNGVTNLSAPAARAASLKTKDYQIQGLTGRNLKVRDNGQKTDVNLDGVSAASANVKGNRVRNLRADSFALTDVPSSTDLKLAGVRAERAEGGGATITGIQSSSIRIHDTGPETLIYSDNLRIARVDTNAATLGNLNIGGVRLTIRQGTIQGRSSDVDAGTVVLNKTGALDQGGTLEAVRIAKPVFVVEPSGRYRVTADMSIGSGIIGSIPIGDARASVSVNNERAELSNLTAAVMDGTLDGNATIAFNNRTVSNVNANFSNLDLAKLASLQGGRVIPLVGQTSGRVDLTFNGTSLRTASGTVAADITASAGNADSGLVPVTGRVELSATNGLFNVDVARLNTPNSELTATGRFDLRSDDSNLNVAVNSRDANEIERLIRVVGLSPALEEQMNSLEVTVAGNMTFNATVTGNLTDPTVIGRATLDQIALRGRTLGSVATDIAISPLGTELRNGTLREADGGTIAFNVNVPQGGANNVAVQATLTNIDAANLIAALPLEKYLPAGIRDFNAQTSGTVNITGLPNDANGEIDISSAAGSVSGQAFDAFIAKAQFRGTVIDLQNLELRSTDGYVKAHGTYDRASTAFDFDLEGRNFQLTAIRNSFTNNESVPAITGNADFVAKATGRSDVPSSYNINFNGTARQVVVNENAFGDVTFKGNTANQILNADLTATLDGRPQVINATLNFGDDNVPFRIATDFNQSPLAPFFALLPQLKGITIGGTGTGRVEFGGNLAKRDDQGKVVFTGEALTGSAEFSQLSLQIQDTPLVATERVVVRFNPREITFESARFAGGGSNVVIAGTKAITDDGINNLSVDGRINLSLLNAFPQIAATDTFFGGFANVAIHLAGVNRTARVSGTATLENAAAATFIGSSRLSFDRLTGRILFSSDQAQIAELHGYLGGGAFTATGGVLFGDGLAVDSFRVALDGTNVTVPLPEDFITTGDAKLEITGRRGQRSPILNVQIAGRILARRSLYTRDIELANIVGARRESSLSSGTSTAIRAPRFDLTIEGRDALVVRNNIADLTASVSLRLTGTTDSPQISGRITANSGTIFFRKDRYIVQRGVLEFPPDTAIEPVINLQAESEIAGYQVFVNLSGPLTDTEQLNATVRSSPALPQADVVSLITTGNLSNTESGIPTLAQTGINTAAEILTDTIINNPARKATDRLFGLNVFEIDPIISGQRLNPSARLTVGRQINNNLRVTYATNLSQDQNQVLALEYRVSNKISFVAQYEQRSLSNVTGNRDNFSFEVRFRRRF
ncbi:MAG TPA: translocation/assembly module TamB domain-containing protein [Pyrinomonadaceae bacterium]|nr:translocation/assembly module TamB domain-containing protein [Pyrinomonadaceae bacterium]